MAAPERRVNECVVGMKNHGHRREETVIWIEVSVTVDSIVYIILWS